MRLHFQSASIDSLEWLQATTQFGVGAVGPETNERNSQICFSFFEGEEAGAGDVKKLAEKAGLVFVKETKEIAVRRNPKRISPG